MPCAPSPPSTFCQEKVVTSSLSQGRSIAKAAEVASQMVRPCAVGRDGIAIRQAAARGGAVPGEHHVGIEIDGREINDLAIGRHLDHGVQLQLLDHIGDPAFAKAFPGQHFDRAGTQQRPHRHFDRAGVGTGDDADAVIGRHAQNFAGQVNRLASAWPCRQRHGANGPRARRQAYQGNNRGSWRRGQRKSAGLPGARPGSADQTWYPSR